MGQDVAGIHLRPVAENDLAYLASFDTDPSISEPFEWRGFRDAQKWRRRWELDGFLGERDSLLIVALDAGVCAGIVTWRASAASPRPGPYEIGIVLHPDYRGQGIGTVAHRLLAEYLFMHTRVHRLEAFTEFDNFAEQRTLEKAGFIREGVLRGRGFVRGDWRDGVIYSRLRTDPS